jgi:hypothetical protein
VSKKGACLLKRAADSSLSPSLQHPSQRAGITAPVAALSGN